MHRRDDFINKKKRQNKHESLSMCGEGGNKSKTRAMKSQLQTNNKNDDLDESNERRELSIISCSRIKIEKSKRKIIKINTKMSQQAENKQYFLR